MTTNISTTCCAHCNKPGPRDEFVWMAHQVYCAECMEAFVRQGWAVRVEGRNYACTAEGVRHFPGLEIVSHCPQDGMPIYRRWLEDGTATDEACPSCLGDKSN